MFVLMTMLVIFAGLAKGPASAIALPGMVFIWFALLMVMAVSVVLFTSVFFATPVNLVFLISPSKLTTPDVDIWTELSPKDCSEETVFSSRRDTPPTVIKFVNSSNRPVSVYWINFSGQRISYGEIPPNRELKLPTYLTHPFVVTSSDGTCIAIYMPITRPGRATIH